MNCELQSCLWQVFSAVVTPCLTENWRLKVPKSKRQWKRQHSRQWGNSQGPRSSHSAIQTFSKRKGGDFHLLGVLVRSWFGASSSIVRVAAVVKKFRQRVLAKCVLRTSCLSTVWRICNYLHLLQQLGVLSTCSDSEFQVG